MAKEQSRLSQILGQEYRSKGAISGLTSALGKRAKEKFDPRNILFSGTGVGSKIGQKIFGKGYSATPEKISKGYTTPTPTKFNEVSEQLEKIGVNSEIIAKKSVAIPVMARDINIMKQNIIKMTNVVTKGKAVRRSEAGFRGKIDEKIYSKEADKLKSETLKKEEKPEEEKGGFGNIFGKLGELFSPQNIMMALQVGIKAFPVTALAASLLNGVWQGYEEWEKTKDLSNASLKFLSGMTFGIVEPDWLQENVITPIVDVIEKVFELIGKYHTAPLMKAYNKIKGIAIKGINGIISILSKIGIPRVEVDVPKIGNIGFGPYYPFSDLAPIAEEVKPPEPPKVTAPSGPSTAQEPSRPTAPTPAAPTTSTSKPTTPTPAPTTTEGKPPTDQTVPPGGKFKDRNEFHKVMYPWAEYVSQKLGGKVPPMAFMGQWAGESGYGSSLPADFNYAGIKAFGKFKKGGYVLTEERYTDAQIQRAQQSGETLYRVLGKDDKMDKGSRKVTVDEWYGKGAWDKAQAEGKNWVQVKSYFAKFDNLQDFADSYVDFLKNPRYARAIASEDAASFGYEVARAGYATASAETYGKKVAAYTAPSGASSAPASTSMASAGGVTSSSPAATPIAAAPATGGAVSQASSEVAEGKRAEIAAANRPIQATSITPNTTNVQQTTTKQEDPQKLTVAAYRRAIT